MVSVEAVPGFAIEAGVKDAEVCRGSPLTLRLTLEAKPKSRAIETL